jgi:hypothetical protein
MTKELKVNLNLDVRTALEVLQVLDSATAGYSKEFAPERIVRLREAMNQIDTGLEKIV